MNETHPLVSAFKGAIATGRKTGNWLYLLASVADGGAPLVIGTVVWTAGRRFLFFPGSKKREVWSDHANQAFNGRCLDHLTLELQPDMTFFAEHVAVMGQGKTRGLRQRGPIRDGYMHPWFTILLNDFSNYSALPRTLRFAFTIPAGDAERRLKAMMSGGQQSVTPIPKVEESEPTFIQIDVWAACGKGWKARSSCALPLALEQELVEDAPIPQDVQQAKHRLALTEEAGIVAIFTHPRGMLRSPALLHARIDSK